MAEEGSTFVLRRSGDVVERITGPRPAGWGYVVRREGVAIELIVAWEGRRLETKSGLVHELAAWDGGESGDVEPSCELVGGACRSEGLYFMLYEPLNQLLLLVKKGYEAPEEVWMLLEQQLERRIDCRRGDHDCEVEQRR